MMLERWFLLSRGLIWLALLVCSACGDAPVALPQPLDAALAPGLSASAGSADGGLRRDASVPGNAADAATEPASLAACAALGGSAPTTIADVVLRINALPPPASLACLVASLPRPLSLVATTSPSSAQPADGHDSPRVFIVSDTLTLSVVAGGHAENLLEFGQWVTPLRSLKAELAFPLVRPLADDAPYKRVLAPDHATTVCRLCHSNETAHETIPNAFVSDALRVATYYDLPIDEVRTLRESCTRRSGEVAGARCDLLRALLDYGEVRQGAFDETIRQGF
jgi:hypothetical protein